MSNAPAVPTDPNAIPGMEDFDPTRGSIPRIGIVSKEGVFEDSLTHERFTEVVGIALGPVQGRVLWDHTMSSDKPWCRSNDAVFGKPFAKEFPWAKSGFNYNDYVTVEADGSTTVTPLKCESCLLRNWDTHPQGGKPWCAEQITFPFMQERGGDWLPILLTVQRTGVKPANQYMSGFYRDRVPMFSAFTKVTLDLNNKGGNTFSVPRFAKLGAVDPEMYPFLTSETRRIFAFLRGDSTPQPVQIATNSTPAQTAPEPQQTASAPSAPTTASSQPIEVQEAAPASVAQEPVVTTPAAAPASPPVEPVQAPSAPAEPAPEAAAPAAPVAEAPAPQPVAGDAPAPAPAAAAGGDDDELPF